MICLRGMKAKPMGALPHKLLHSPAINLRDAGFPIHCENHNSGNSTGCHVISLLLSPLEAMMMTSEVIPNSHSARHLLPPPPSRLLYVVCFQKRAVPSLVPSFPQSTRKDRFRFPLRCFSREHLTYLYPHLPAKELQRYCPLKLS